MTRASLFLVRTTFLSPPGNLDSQTLVSTMMPAGSIGLSVRWTERPRRPRQGADRYWLLEPCDHGGGPAPDAPTSPGGCHPIPAAVAIPARPAGPLLIIDGERDARRSSSDGARLAERPTRAGAAVSHRVLPVRHSITAMDREIARKWLATGV